ncbi:1,4-alpha-glucan branching protein GlgB [Clostridium hydrogenum]|uniref:1,4-alpha-glucan branching protein GlgB n=1 Tax=Clostridium hydrogenum TaxID=2855764 RepID=UPI001F23A89E|nr:1,4-alpha-glucan branching protein GlgB [Clostridium hydrogenum]
MILQDFYDGKAFDAYEYFGAHKENSTFTFRTYAPAARKVTIIGEFNGWQEQDMYQEAQSGVFSISGVPADYGMMYKYCIYGNDGSRQEHCDPYGFFMELRPGACSITTDIKKYRFHDEEWIQSRSVNYDKPLNIYELHLGSWKKKSEEETGWYSYSEIANLLIDYVRENGYTHIEVMPISEHPFDGSWGYQNTGFFAPTSRYGTPDELKEMIDKLHQAGIGVILDFVPVHFAVDGYGLKKYDGTCLYEYPSEDVGTSEWGSCNFIYSRREVRCFIQSSANYWIKEFHFDGLRMDAVSRLIYWQGDESRGENGESIEFLKVMNKELKRLHPTAMIIAEDSSHYEGVTKSVDMGGLGFDYKWDLGWMHDTLEYFQTGPEYRPRDYHKLTFSMMYFYNERFILAFSHDEGVHGKATILQKMNGQYDSKFPQARAMYLYMLMHPGKKLNFMANEIGQLREWDEKREQDWDILKYPIHGAFHQYMIGLNKLYTYYSALQDDYNINNFRWADCNQNDSCIYAIMRFGAKATLLAIFNFSDKDCTSYSVPLKEGQKAKLLLNSNWERFNGTISQRRRMHKTEKNNGHPKLTVKISAFSGMLFEIKQLKL